MRESVIECYLKQRFRKAGGSVRKVRWIGHNGAPDRLVMLGGDHALVELKKPGETPESHQIREHRRLREAGFTVFVFDSLEEIDWLIREMKTDDRLLQRDRSVRGQVAAQPDSRRAYSAR